MKLMRFVVRRGLFIGIVGLMLSLCQNSALGTPVLYAVGQAIGSGHNHDVGNFLWSIDLTTGHATQVAPISRGIAGLATGADGTLYGRSGVSLLEIGITDASLTLVGDSTVPGSATSLDILSDGRAFTLPFNSNFDTAQLHQVDLSTGNQTPIGSDTSLIDAIDTAFPNRDKTYGPFVISLGNVADTLYGLDLETNTLIEIDPDTGSASAIGAYYAATMEDSAGYWSGFAGLTGVDLDEDGVNDALYGVINYYYDNALGDTVAMGAIGRFDLTDSTWSLVGTNPGVIFYSAAAGEPVPEPATLLLMGGGMFAVRQVRRMREAT